MSNRFLRLTLVDDREPIVVNVAHITHVVARPDGGTFVYVLDNDYALPVVEAFEAVGLKVCAEAIYG